jgi:MFS family permease
MKQIVIAVALLAIVLFLAMPSSPWEFDEPLFFQALHRYDPLAHHPPPPGYPLFIGFAQLVRMVVASDFATLVAISFAGSLIAFVMLALALRNMTGDIATGVAGAALFYFSPTMLVHSTLPISEGGALALLATCLYFATLCGSADPRRRSCALFALFAALTVGWRIQFAIFVVPLFLVSVLMMRTWRDRFIALGTFTIVCLLWLVPLTMAVGGLRELVAFETGQAGYLAAHDANESRGGWSPVAIAFRFVAHPWGTKFLSLPILILAAIGLGHLVRRRQKAFIPVVIAGALYIAFALWIMDPADGVRYAIPFTLLVAICAACGGQALLPVRLRWLPPALLAGAAMFYTAPMLWQRHTTASPPVQAAQYALANYPSSAVVLYELPLWPHATYFLADRNPRRIDEGLREFFDDPNMPLFIYANGATSQPGARTFRWEASDAYSKLTRNHYRVVSVIPVTPERRFRVVRNVHAPEREIDGDEWRWVTSPGEIQLAVGPARDVILRLGLPERYPFETNDVTVSIAQGAAEAAALHKTVLRRGSSQEVTISVPAGAPVIRIEASRTFRPIDVPGSLSQDPRSLSVKLYDFRTRVSAAVAVPRAASRQSAPQTAPPRRSPAQQPRAAS